MARATTPQIQGGALRLPDGGTVALDGAAWQAWLAEPSSTAFGYTSAAGSYTARRERQRNSWYWYAYRRLGGRLRKLYLGRAGDLTPARLEAVADELAARPAEPAPPADARPPAPLLLGTKLRAPAPRAGFVTRPRLLRRLADGLRLPLTIVVAPPGFGKTTLAADALRAAGDGLRWAWLSLDAADNDPARFLAYVAAALDAIEPGLLAPALPVLQLPQSGEAVLAALLNALAAAPGELVLAFDDFHLIDEPEIHALLAAAAEQLPPQVHLVVLSRSDPPLPLARMRARGRLHEIRAADLRFTADEAGAFLGDTMGLALAPGAVAELERRTEGWAAGLQLAALAMRDRGDAGRFIASFAGSHRAVADYLAEEVIERQPDDVQHFLLASSVLERMCGELCDALGAVWGAAPAPGSSQALIERLDRANLFVVPLDDERRWYRYHHLFGEMLRDRLRRSRPELPLALHRRAAEWYRAAGLMSEAIDHALAGEDYPLAADMVEVAVGSVIWMLNQSRTTMHWLNRFPPAFLQTRPLLLLARVWVMLAQVRLNDVEQSLRQLEANPSHEAAVRGHIAATRSFVYRLNGDITAAVAAAHHALDDLPDDDINVRSLVANNLESCYMALGDVRRADAVLRGWDEAGLPPHSFHRLNLTLGRAGMARARGRLPEAIALTEDALRAMLESDRTELPSTGLIHVILAELHYERNELEAAERHATTALSLGDRWWNNDVLVNANSVLGQVRLAQGSPEAELLFGEVERLLKAYNAPGIVRELEIGQARAALLAGRMDEAWRWVERAGLSPEDDPTPIKGYEYMVFARACICDGRAAAALPLLDRMMSQAEAGEYVERQIELHKLRALAHGALEQHRAAYDALSCALALAHPGGFVRTFLDEGPPLERLLAALLSQDAPIDGPLRSYATALHRAFGARTSAAPAASDPDALTRRELEVLRELAAGLGNKQIAYRLGVEPSTVRSHVKAIYAKLGAGGRVEAVALARQRGLLDR